MKIYKGRCPKSEEKKLIETLDEVFFSEEDRDFMSLLPKLYEDKYNPSYNNFIIKEDSEIKAAVGCFPMNAVAAGRKLRIMGIGNVAVTKDCRRKGYMIELMNLALETMIAEDYDYSLLGGQRQRYEHFGYGPAGRCINFTINLGNIERILGREATTDFTAKVLTEENTEAIAKVRALYEKSPFYVERREEDTVKILRSWSSTPYAVYSGDEFKGYFVFGYKGTLAEVKAEKTEDLLDILMAAMNVMECDSVSFSAPIYDTEVCNFMSERCCGMAICHAEQLNILNYGRFIEAFLAIKAERLNLCSGTLNVLIHGYKKDERLAITVSGKDISVCETEAQPDIELEHLEAISFFAGNYSAKRLALPAFAQNWFPLDFFVTGQDNV